MDLKLAIVSHQSFSTLGGISVHIRQLAEALFELGVDVEVIAPASEPIRQSLSPFPVTLIPMNSKLQTMRTLEFSYKTYRYLEKNRGNFDAVHGSQWSNLFIVTHKEELRLPVVTKMHGVTFYLLKRAFKFKPLSIHSDVGWFITAPLYSFIESNILKMSDGVICISKTVLDEASCLIGRRDRYKFTYIYNGVDYKTFRPLKHKYKLKQRIGLDEDYKCILYAGRVEPMKGLHYLVSSVKKLLKTIPRLKLVIVGDFNENPMYTKHLCELAKPKENFIFLGKVPHRYMPEIYSMCDVFVTPSLYEALGNTALEAMACGRPVLASKVGGLRELIKHGERGFLVNPRLIEKQLVEYLTLILSDDKLSQRMGEKGRKFIVENFSWEKTAIQTANFITKLIY